ncbi:hypothetical protein DSO57_1037535, partial [Entomophthora muscae]
MSSHNSNPDQDLQFKHHHDAPKLDYTPERPDFHEPNACLPGINTAFYICCNNVYSTHYMALDHWMDNHFLPFNGTINTVTPHGHLPSSYYPPNPCKSEDDLLDFRPTPHTRPPNEFENPYVAVLAIAYDFLEAIVSKSEEYYLFLALILSSNSLDFGCDLTEHITYFPLWADYCYPNLPKVINVMPDSKEIQGTTNFKIMLYNCYRDTNGFYICPTHGCEKKYKGKSGLNYHLKKGKCTVINTQI